MLIACLLSFALAAAPEPTPTPNDPAFDALVKLAGVWEKPMEGAAGKKGAKMTTECRVTSGGSVVVERMFARAPHEMVNMFHRDAGDLVLTHYCAAGSQPRMKLKRGGPAGTYVFECQSVSKLASHDADHMHTLSLTVKDADHIEQMWTSFEAGKPGTPFGGLPTRVPAKP